MFDDRLRDQLLARYANRPDHERPEHYLIATSPDRAAQREWLNQALTLLPQPGRSKLWSRLQNGKAFLESYHELATVAILQSAGLLPRYEEPFDRLTPDLTVFGEPCRPTVLIEVANRMRSDNTDKEERRWRDLRRRVRQIPVPVGIVTRSVTMTAPTADVAKRIATELKEWLLLPRHLSTRLDVAGYQFAVYGPLPGLYADLAYPSASRWMNSDVDMARPIQKKATRYGPLAEHLRVPLVIVLCADYRLPLDVDMLRAAVAGQLRTTLNMNLLSETLPTGRLRMHMTDSSPRWHPGLSAVAWLSPATDAPGTLTVLSAQTARLEHGLPVGGRIQVG